MIESDFEDLRTDQEVRWDNFEQLLITGKIKQKAVIRFAGDDFRVKLVARSDEVVTFKVLGDKLWLASNTLAFSLRTMESNDTELIEIIK